MQYLDKALGKLRDLGLMPEKTEEAPVIALIERISALDPDRTLAIARTLNQASLFNTVVREQLEAMRARVQPMLAAPVHVGTNRVLVGHDDPFEASTGIYPEPQGVAYVFRPLGEDGGPGVGFELVARIEAEIWSQLPRP